MTEYLKELGPQLVVVEATGGLETAVTAELAAEGLPVVVAEPEKGAGLCPGHRATGEDGRVGRPGAGAIRGNPAAPAAGAARRGDPGTEGAGGAPAAVGGDDHGGGEPAAEGQRGGSGPGWKST